MPATTHGFSEKVALITGGENSFGRAVAMQLALLGSYVVVGYAGEDAENERSLAELKNLGTLAHAVRADVSTTSGAKSLVDEVEKIYGRIDLLVNCTKSAPGNAFEDVSEAEFGKMTDESQKAAFFVTQAALKLMMTRPKPKIVNLVSACDTPETSGNPLFAASQNWLVGFTQAMAKTLPKNFRANAVAVSEKQKQTEDLDAELFRRKKGISEDDVARVIVYLLSSEAVALNGQMLNVE